MSARFALLAAAALLAASPAAAQFRWPWESAPAEAPAAPSTPAPQAAPSAAPQVMRVTPPRRPAGLGAETAEARAPVAGTPSVAAASAPVPTSVQAAPSVQAAAVTAPLSDQDIVERANAYLNGITSLTGDFVQVGGDGRRVGGRLYLSRPGRLRFEYERPSTLEVIADGRSVAVRDAKLNTQDLYLIGQTPLKFLLRENVNLARDVRLTDAAQEADGVRVALEDRSTLGGTSKITLYFDRDMTRLTRWRVIDPQGFQTQVSLSNLQRGGRVDPQLFVINYDRNDAVSNR